MQAAPPPRRIRSRRSAGGPPWFPLAFFSSLAVLFIQFYTPSEELLLGPFGRSSVELRTPAARPAPDAFGKSGGVSMRFTLPGDTMTFPLEVFGDPSALMYQWIQMGSLIPVDSLRPLRGATILAPMEPGFYRLALAGGEETRILQDVTLAVKVPFATKKGTTLNGYRIGTYVSESNGARGRETPDGFIQVAEGDLDLPLSAHLRVADFLTQDNQSVWPRYSVVNPRILDKLELVIAELEKQKPGSSIKVAVDVHSAFRTPLHNRLRSHASDSRHQYGDAVDVSIDANGDGRVNAKDLALITAAVDSIERRYPELAGGLGTYSGIQYRAPYVHIDARGTRARWRG